MRPVLDSRSRPLRDLRISVTDRCNFRCTYCMPKEVFGRDYRFLPRDRAAHLRGDRAAGAELRRAGRAKIRLTGGEPLLRRELERLVAMLAGIPGIEDLALTTNGVRARRARRRRSGTPACARDGQPRRARRRVVRAR